MHIGLEERSDGGGGTASGMSARADASGNLERLLRALRKRLEAYVGRRMPADLRSTTDVQDVMQDIYYEAFRRPERFDGSAAAASSSAVLFGIARHVLDEMIRKQRAAKRGGRVKTWSGGNGRDAAAGDDVDLLLQELAVYTRTPSQSAMAHEEAAALEQSIDRLPSDYRRAIRMQYFDGLCAREIGKTLNRSDEAVHQLVTRAKRLLRLEHGLA